MTTFHWVRHGPTHEKAFTGWRDVPADLSDHAALARLDATLPHNALLISSDLSRAIATADCLGKTRQRLPHDPALREFDFGAWDGKHFTEVAASHPDLSRRYWEEPGDIAPPGGESWNAAAARINAAVEALCAAYPKAHIIAVAHFGAILTQYQRAAAITPYEALAQKIDNLSVTTLQVSTGNWQVARVNHLA